MIFAYVTYPKVVIRLLQHMTRPGGIHHSFAEVRRQKVGKPSPSILIPGGRSPSVCTQWIFPPQEGETLLDINVSVGFSRQGKPFWLRLLFFFFDVMRSKDPTRCICKGFFDTMRDSGRISCLLVNFL